jgi:spermidine/putrescine-binding protein
VVNERYAVDKGLQQSISRLEFLGLGAAVGAGLLLPGCGGDDDEGAGTGGSQAAATPTTPAKKPDQLIVRAWSGSFQEAMAAGPGTTFTAETGIPIKWDLSDSSVSFAQAQTAIRAGNRPPFDVMWNTSVNGYLSIAQDLLTPLDPEIVTNIKDLNTGIAQPPDGSWGYTGLYGYSVPIMYRSDASVGPFETWEDLWDPKYKKSVAMCNVIVCSISTVAKMVDVDITTPDVDMTPVFDKFAELQPNVARLGDDAAMVQSLSTGQAPIVWGLIADGLAAKASGAPVKWTVPEEGATVDRDVIWVCGNIPDEVAYYGQIFVNHALSADNQFLLADKLGAVPVNLNTKLPEYMVGDPAFPFTTEEVEKYAIVVPTDVLAENNSEWQTQFDQALKA